MFSEKSARTKFFSNIFKAKKTAFVLFFAFLFSFFSFNANLDFPKRAISHLGALSPVFSVFDFSAEFAKAQAGSTTTASSTSATPVESKTDAQANTAADTSDWTGAAIKLVSRMILYVAQIMLQIAMFGLAFVIQIAGYNGYLDSVAVNVGWVLVRDITNMFFVVVLLLVAFGTILGLEQYEWKKMLVKFFFAAIIVNFSRTICGLIIDIAQVVMVTFVNGIAATAGGNLINALGLTNIFSLSSDASYSGGAIDYQIFGAAVAAVTFSAITMAMMFVFVYMLAARLIVLWILIVLSPIAFVFSIIPQTEKYASQWWSEFGNYVIVGPVVVFFMWLAFAVVGGGNVQEEIANYSQVPDANKRLDGVQNIVSKAMDWNNMANFVIGIGILLVGAKTAQSLGTIGGSAMSNATDFGKKVATIASGVSLARWGMDKGKAVAAGGAALAGKGLYTGLLENRVERIKNAAWTQTVGAWRDWRAAGGAQFKYKKDDSQPDGLAKDSYGNAMLEYDENGRPILEKNARKGIAASLQRGFYKRQFDLLRSKKQREKVEKSINLREEIMMKRANATPEHWMQTFGQKKVADLDRIEAGVLEAEEERGAAKMGEYKALGRAGILGSERIKYDPKIGKEEFQSGKGTVAQQIVEHEEKKAKTDTQIKRIMSEAKNAFLRDGKNSKLINAKIAAQLGVDLADSAAHLAEGGAKLHYLQANQDLLVRKAALKGEEKEEHALMEEVEKRAELKYVRSHDAEHTLEKQKAAEMRTKVLQGSIEEEESKIDIRVQGENLNLIREMNESAQAKSADESFIKALKDEQLKQQIEEAAKRLEEATESGDKAALEELARNNIFVKAMKQAGEANLQGEVVKIVQTEMSSAVEGEYIDKKLRGYGAPASSLVGVAKKYGDDLNSLNNSALAQALLSNLSLVANEAGENGVKDISKRAALFGTLNKVNMECYIDDTIGALVAEFNKLKDPNLNQAERDRIAKLQETFGDGAGGLGLITGDAATGFKGVSNQKNSALLQNYAITGGNMNLMRQHKLIEDAMEKPENKDKSYSEVLHEVLGADAEGFKKEMKSYDTFFREATTSFKNQALAGGHIQIGGNQTFDENLGFHRMSTSSEAAGIMEAEVRKRGSKAGYQYQSVGNINTSTGRLERVNLREFGNTIGKVTSNLEADKIQDRTIDALMGYKPSQAKVASSSGHGVLGGSEEAIKEAYGSMEEFIKNVVAPQLAAGPQAFALMAQKKFGNVDAIAAKNGAIKVKIGNIESEDLEGLIKQVQTTYGSKLDKELNDMLSTSLQQASALKKEASKPKNKRQSQAEREEESSEGGTT